MKTYVKKPIPVQACQWTGDNLGELADWAYPVLSGNAKDPRIIHIETAEGVMTAEVGAWVIRGVRGEFYACKEDIFAETYQPTEEPHD